MPNATVKQSVAFTPDTPPLLYHEICDSNRAIGCFPQKSGLKIFPDRFKMAKTCKHKKKITKMKKACFLLSKNLFQKQMYGLKLHLVVGL